MCIVVLLMLSQLISYSVIWKVLSCDFLAHNCLFMVDLIVILIIIFSTLNFMYCCYYAECWQCSVSFSWMFWTLSKYNTITLSAAGSNGRELSNSLLGYLIMYLTILFRLKTNTNYRRSEISYSRLDIVYGFKRNLPQSWIGKVLQLHFWRFMKFTIVIW
jgi:hypothetical protein